MVANSEQSVDNNEECKVATTASILRDLLNVGRIRPLDAAFAEFIIHHEHADSVLDHGGIHIVGLLAAYLSSRLGEQDSCLTLHSFYQPFLPFYHFGSSAELNHVLAASTCVARLDANRPSTDINKPLVLEGNELYMQRYWQYEVHLADKINSMTGQPSVLDMDEGRALLAQLFIHKAPLPVDEAPSNANGTEYDIDWQKVAVCLAASQNVSVITGGPGTGKTTTVIRLMALLQGLARHKKSRLQIKLAAPTGKAAARLSQSISAAMGHLPEALQADLPTQCSTIHRLLGSIPNSPYFRFNEQHPLHVDVLIVDEASMVDLPLMSKLFAALPRHAKIILLGDKDQLASVEAGSVLSDICAAAQNFSPTVYNQPPPYSSDALTVIKALCQIELSTPYVNNAKISNSLALLHKSYRFSEHSGIGRLARAMNTGKLPASKALFANTDYPDVRWNASDEPKALVNNLLKGYQAYFSCVQTLCTDGQFETQGTEVFALLQQQQVLCAQKEATWGVHQMNALIESELNKQGLIDLGRDFYIGRPVMLRQNDHSLGLFNGDIGIVMPDEQNEGLVKVWFVTEQNTLRGVLPSRLPPHETVYAMTIHKSQGSEFEHVYLCLPRVETRSQARLLSRELLYTGLTRAKKSFTLYSDEQALSVSIARRCKRGSGLAKRLIG
ncbi:exodeoxyribonuclease V subunit alpha [Paraglaciecola polaris]|uniref:RecBCD enzyme subunit RecD n=2 Tax=Paraglaciecola polaris TaxID=222814 RepID=K6Z6S8_9ALTE|nr:exodeoxyribonuclease V subunit alpha [Paraglaciecola polaris]GAC31881.1 exodeoxyribonuclease V alpha subunit [Paraglaciecola polaris LMG 21857]